MFAGWGQSGDQGVGGRRGEEGGGEGRRWRERGVGEGRGGGFGKQEWRQREEVRRWESVCVW